MYSCVPVCGGWRAMSGFTDCLFFLRQNFSLSWNLGHTRAGQWAPVIHLSQPSWCWDYTHGSLCLAFCFVASEDWTQLGLCTWKASTLRWCYFPISTINFGGTFFLYISTVWLCKGKYFIIRSCRVEMIKIL